MAGSYIMKDFLYIHLEKTGSSTFISGVATIDWIQETGSRGQGDPPSWDHFPYGYGRTTFDLPKEYWDWPIVATIRNPFTWYPSYWDFFKDADDGINQRLAPFDNFNDWVLSEPGWYQDLCQARIPYNAKLIHMENLHQEMMQVVEEIRGPIPEDLKQLVLSRGNSQVNAARDKPYALYYRPETIQAIQRECSGLFTWAYDGDMSFPEEITLEQLVPDENDRRTLRESRLARDRSWKEKGE